MRLFAQSLSVVFFLATVAAHAAVPPLSQEMREEMAHDIVTSVVMSSSSEVKKLSRGKSNMVHTVLLEVTSASKGDIMPGQRIEVTYWKAHTRPDGWCGPSGQYGIIHEGDTITAYMVPLSGGVYSLLEPNGFDVIE